MNDTHNTYINHCANKKFAIIDLGSNSCRLLIAQQNDKSYQVIHSFSRITRLAEGISESNELSDNAQKRALDALKECKKRLLKYNPEYTRFVTTQACRSAKNSPQFIQQVKQLLDFDLEIIDEIEESKLSLLGCYEMLNIEQEHAIVFDVGGASTELIYAKNDGQNFVFQNTISIPYGVLTISETYGNYLQKIFEDMKQSLYYKYQKFFMENNLSDLNPSKLQIVGCSGTATSLAAIHLGLRQYNKQLVNGTVLNFEDIITIKNLIYSAQNDSNEHLNNHYINNNINTKSSLFIAGLIIVISIMECLKKTSFTVADRGVRDGLLLDLYNNQIK